MFIYHNFVISNYYLSFILILYRSCRNKSPVLAIKKLVEKIFKLQEERSSVGRPTLPSRVKLIYSPTLSACNTEGGTRVVRGDGDGDGDRE